MTAPKQKNGITQYKPADLEKLHTDEATAGASGWISLIRAKEVFSQSRSAIIDVCHTYHVPLRQLSNHGQLLMSEIAFNYVLTHTPELASTSEQDTGQARLQRLRSEAEQEVKAQMKKEYLAKLEATKL